MEKIKTEPGKVNIAKACKQPAIPNQKSKIKNQK
jgi:hypothetical protein